MTSLDQNSAEFLLTLWAPLSCFVTKLSVMSQSVCGDKTPFCPHPPSAGPQVKGRLYARRLFPGSRTRRRLSGPLPPSRGPGCLNSQSRGQQAKDAGAVPTGSGAGLPAAWTEGAQVHPEVPECPHPLQAQARRVRARRRQSQGGRPPRSLEMSALASVLGEPFLLNRPAPLETPPAPFSEVVQGWLGGAYPSVHTLPTERSAQPVQGTSIYGAHTAPPPAPHPRAWH